MLMDDLVKELRRLDRWKKEAVVVMKDWEECYDILSNAGHPAPLGSFKSKHVAGYLKLAVDAEKEREGG